MKTFGFTGRNGTRILVKYPGIGSPVRPNALSESERNLAGGTIQPRLTARKIDSRISEWSFSFTRSIVSLMFILPLYYSIFSEVGPASFSCLGCSIMAVSAYFDASGLRRASPTHERCTLLALRQGAGPTFAPRRRSDALKPCRDNGL